MNNKLLFVVVLTAVFVVTYGRLFKEEFTFPNLRRNKGWTFLDRIKLGEGYAMVRLSVRLQIK